RWAAGVLRRNSAKTRLVEVQTINERVDKADRIVAINIVVDPRRQKLAWLRSQPSIWCMPRF
ncbi:MAG TPA: hypothetical protein VME45_19785, partial [Stellaceae bacterium]|nr:hypothetical protein [Stellaceae bacterium]